MTTAAERADAVARTSYGRLVALLSARHGDVAGAQDALADAFRLALETWPQRGVPGKPEAWLLAVARNRDRNARQSAGVRRAVPIDDVDIADADSAPYDIPDERLKLLFVCAHPAIDEALRTPLMLQTVLGLDAERIAQAFLVPKAAMAQRLVRVKKKIKEARIPFALPDRSEMPERLEAVLEAIYGAQAIGFDLRWGQIGRQELGREALFLARLLCELLPNQAEVLGLAALIGHIQARTAAQHSATGDYRPLADQDPADWDHDLIAEAEIRLAQAASHRQLGRYQLEAAIQSVHARRTVTGATDWPALALLYEGLMRLAPSIGAAVGRAVAIGHAQGALAGLAALDQIDASVADGFQPAWAARAHLLARAGRLPAAREAYARAIALAADPSVQRYLSSQSEALA